MADDHDLAIRLEGDAVGFIVSSGDVRNGPSARTERGVQTTVGVIASNCEFPRGSVVAPTSGNDLSIWLECDIAYEVGPGAMVGGCHAVDVECCVQGAVGVVAHDQEVAVGSDIAGTAYNDLAVGLQHDAVYVVFIGGNVDDGSAVAGETACSGEFDCGVVGYSDGIDSAGDGGGASS